MNIWPDFELTNTDDIVKTIQSYQCSSRELKLRTRAGMGYCGGRTCRFLIDSIIQNVSEQSIQDVPLKYQPPVRPITFNINEGFTGGVNNES